MGEVNADLVSSTGEQSAVEEREPGWLAPAGIAGTNLQQRDLGRRRRRACDDPDAPVAIGGGDALERKLQPGPGPAPAPGYERSVVLGRPARGELPVQRQQRRPASGNDDQPRSLAIEPVRQFQETILRPRRPQPLDEAGCNATTAVNRQAGGLVEHQPGRVFMNNGAVGQRS